MLVALLSGGLHPHYYCLPILKAEQHRQALLRAIASGSKKFFLGTDSAPHVQAKKEGCCGAAGCFTAHAAMELYTRAFESIGKLDNLQAFACENGADFYGIKRNAGYTMLRRQEWRVPASFPFQDGELIPFNAGESVEWTLVDE